ncbi:MAG: peptidoglycan DD-metalloendopeptidase family protein [Gammaproteobacteria bacterium]|nr:peptidoglycan DD-metalloendopeptidase family protein [Gammaproteobacteria bacterium]MDH3934357.1 peptidoglycan DD-metalloendopeptidase family protein [Gammaproteobacteria bacterium]MDH3972509.1 peptidoglycan DD-metalloendopeptidase family protein [Gammaproteobacteria bacterium]MDH3985293.1 peptidoglycan DD-metalloendopeptidase family protein [Gammaproteobacteria bacterium]
MRYRYLTIAVCLLLLSACGSQSARAPIDARNNQSTTAKSSAPRAAAKKSSGDYTVVERGDTLYSIAWAHGLGYHQLASLNGIRAPYTIYSGQRLRVRPAVRSNGVTVAPLRQGKAVVASKPVAAPAVKPVARQASTPAPAAASNKPFNGPWIWPTRGRVLSKFQSNASGKRGIEIGGHADQPVNAAGNGTVVYAGSGLVGYGRLIIVKHSENLLSAYGHNSKLLVAEGEYVSAGQMIAKMGSSGTSRNELYFEIRKDGKPVDPLKYLPRQ